MAVRWKEVHSDHCYCCSSHLPLTGVRSREPLHVVCFHTVICLNLHLTRPPSPPLLPLTISPDVILRHPRALPPDTLLTTMSAENIKNCKYTAPRSCLHLPAMPNALLPCILPFPNHALDHSHLFCSPHPFRSQGYREPVVAARKPRMHRSRHAADVAPTGSSFGLRTSTRVPGANLGSDTGSVAVTKRSVFGPPSNHRADPGRFLKKTGARSSRTSQRTFAAATSAGICPQ